MSLKAVKEAALSVVHSVPDSGTCLKCRLDAEIAALEKAAKTLKDADVPNVLPRDEAEQAWALIQSIAKEAE